LNRQATVKNDDKRQVSFLGSVNVPKLMDLGIGKLDLRFNELNYTVKNTRKWEGYDGLPFKSVTLDELEKQRQKVKRRIRYLRRRGWNLRKIKQEVENASDFAWSIDSDLKREPPKSPMRIS